MNADVRLFRLGEVPMSEFGAGEGMASISRLIGPDSSRTMGAYLARFDGRSVPWTVKYDELIVGITGTFRLWTSDRIYELSAGDVLWVGAGTELRYEGDRATVFMAIAPVDWRNRHNT